MQKPVGLVDFLGDSVPNISSTRTLAVTIDYEELCYQVTLYLYRHFVID